MLNFLIILHNKKLIIKINVYISNHMATILIIIKMTKVLLKIKVCGSVADGNWNYPDLIQSIIISENESKILTYFCDKFPNANAAFWNGYDFDCVLSDYDIEYIYDEKYINAFEKIYGNEYGSTNLYDHMVNAIKKYYRLYLEKSINEDEDYDPDEDDLEIENLKIVEGKICSTMTE